MKRLSNVRATDRLRRSRNAIRPCHSLMTSRLFFLHSNSDTKTHIFYHYLLRFYLNFFFPTATYYHGKKFPDQTDKKNAIQETIDLEMRPGWRPTQMFAFQKQKFFCKGTKRFSLSRFDVIWIEFPYTLFYHRFSPILN